MMEFTVVVSRLACMFCFVNNLADWHYACIRHYNEAWLEETGALTGEEKSALADFAVIAQEFGYGDKWLGCPFVVSENETQAWEKVRDLVGDARVESLKRCFQAMEARFKRIWEKDAPRLDGLSGRLTELLQSDKVARAASALERYFDVPFPGLTVHLVISRGQSVSGGANEGPGHITIAALEVDDPMRIVEVILHETGHLLEVPKFKPLYLEFSKARGLRDIKGEKSWDAHVLVREAMLGALAPGGCLSPLLGREARDFAAEADRALSRGRTDTADLLRLTGLYVPLVGSYVKSGRVLDAELIDQAIRLFEEKRPELCIGKT